jgi:UrcA family protein
MLTAIAKTPAISRAATRTATLAATVLATFAGAALAGSMDADSVPSVSITYADLNVGTPQGADQLYQRIVRAASTVCPAADIRDLTAFRIYRTCVQDAVARAVSSISSPQLAAVYEAHTHRG